jgi:hypothetical protein
MVIATKFWFAGSLLARARADNLRREAGKDWVRETRTAEEHAMTYLEYVIARLRGVRRGAAVGSSSRRACRSARTAQRPPAREARIPPPRAPADHGAER